MMKQDYAFYLLITFLVFTIVYFIYFFLRQKPFLSHIIAQPENEFLRDKSETVIEIGDTKKTIETLQVPLLIEVSPQHDVLLNQKVHTKNINVLFIDDEPHNLTAFKAVFRRDFNIFVTESVNEAFEILNDQNIHVILSDQRMPIMTGIEFFESIAESNPEPIRILITGYADLNTIIDAINRGDVYKFYTKPWSEDEIRNAIYKAYEVFELRQKNKALSKTLLDAVQKIDEFISSQAHTEI